MRIALLSDIHGNSVALDTALEDIQRRGGVDHYWVLGDLCAIGYDPIGVLERLKTLPNLTVIKGNADRYVSSMDLPPPSIESAQANPDLTPVLAEVYSNFHWTRGALDATGWTTWLRGLPYDHHTTLPDGTQVYLVHSSPDTDEGKGLNPARTDEELDDLLADVSADLICVGHFHTPLHRYFRDKQIVNPGSICNTFHLDAHTYYAILDATTSGFDLTFYAVPYDVDLAINKARQTLNIGNDYNMNAMAGKVVPSWKKHWDGVAHFPEIIIG